MIFEPTKKVPDDPKTVSTQNVSPDDVPLTPGQSALKARLESELGDERPTHRLTLVSGRVILCRLVGESQAAVRACENFGYSGHITSTYNRSDIAGIELLPARAFEITRADLVLAEEFPRDHFWKSPPYTIVTDASFDAVEKILRLLSVLRVEFESNFADLIRNDQHARNIQFVFFNNESDYNAYTQRAAPGFIGSAGFYSHRNDRLVILNQFGTQRYATTQEQLEKQRRSLTSGRDHESAGHIEAARQLAVIRSDITSETKSMTERVIRHEGAHQLFNSYHVHSPDGIEPTWLPEGLAQYCETEEIGRYNHTAAGSLVKARNAGKLIPLATLINHRDPAGFLILGKEQAEFAYTESWALVSLLMRDEFRSGFYDYIRHYRDIRDANKAAAALREDSLQVLLTCLKMDLPAFTSQWDDHLRHL